MAHDKVSDTQLDEILNQYKQAGGDIWLRIAHDCKQARSDLRHLIEMIESKTDEHVVLERVKSLKNRYEWKAPVKVSKVKIYE